MRLAGHGALEGGERGALEPRLDVQLDEAERGAHVVGVDRQDLLEDGHRVAPVGAGAGELGLGEEHVHVARVRDGRGLLDPLALLVAALRELAGEQQALDGGLGFGGAAREIAGAVLGAAVAAGRREVAGERLERGGRWVGPSDHALEGLHRTLGPSARGRRGRGLVGPAPGRRGARRGLGMAGELGGRRARRGEEIGHHLDAQIGGAPLVGDPHGELGRLVGAADLDRDAVVAGLERDRRGEAVDVELAVARVLQHHLAVPGDAEGPRRADPERDAARRPRARLGRDVAGREGADVLARAHDLAEVDPPVGRGRRRQAPAHGPLLAVVGAPEVERLPRLHLGRERTPEPRLVLVVEGAQRHPAVDEAQARDAGGGAVEVAPAAPRERADQRGVHAGRGRRARALDDLVDRLLDLGRVCAVPHAPDVPQRRVDLRPPGGPDGRRRAHEVRVDGADVGGGLRRARGHDRGERDQRPGALPPPPTGLWALRIHRGGLSRAGRPRSRLECPRRAWNRRRGCVRPYVWCTSRPSRACRWGRTSKPR